MGTFWKALVVMILTLPVAAYVTGSVVGGQDRLPDQRPPVVVDDSTRVPGSTSPSSPSDRPSGDDGADDGSGGRDDDIDDEVEIVRPEPKHVEDAGDDAGEDRHDGSDDDDAGGPDGADDSGGDD